MGSGLPIHTDALVIGAGPVGLFQVFQLGLQGIHAHVVDALPHAGGQPVELYADKAIYDIPGVPRCTGQSLTDNLLQQIAPFQASFHWGEAVSTLSRQSDDGSGSGGCFAVGTDHGTQFLAKTVFIAAGVGAFQPKRLKLPGLAAFEGTQLLYRIAQPEQLAQRRVVVVGGDDTALAWALRLSEPGPQQAASVTLVHRRDGFQADENTVAAVRARCATGGMQFVVGQVTGHDAPAGQLTAAHITGPDGQTHPLALDVLTVFLGISPQLGPVAQWGLAMERKQLTVDTETFSTTEAGIFAVGDIITYPGKRKLIVCGFHECTLAAYAAAQLVFPGRPEVQLYTSSSSHLHALLGKGPAPQA